VRNAKPSVSRDEPALRQYPAVFDHTSPFRRQFEPTAVLSGISSFPRAWRLSLVRESPSLHHYQETDEGGIISSLSCHPW
jgi:hypothetical protein